MRHWSDPLGNSSRDRALVVLNEPIPSLAALDRVWRISTLRYCADGGANRLHDLLEPTGQIDDYLPDLLKGDFDSLRDDVRHYYQSKGVPLIEDGDVNATDLMKCFKSLQEEEARRGHQFDVLLLGGLTGRLDQTAHTLHMLVKLRKSRPVVWVVSDFSIACVLDEGSHSMEIDHSKYGKTCGILPIGVDSATISTKGLEWDISACTAAMPKPKGIQLLTADWETSFNTRLSTSNHLVADRVEIKTDKPVVWTCELKPPM